MEKAKKSSARVTDAEVVELPENTVWFYRHRGTTYGPVSAIDLRAAAHLGFLQPKDSVRCKDQSEWLQARSITWLFSGRPDANSP